MSEDHPDYVPPDLRRDDITPPQQNNSKCRDVSPSPVTRVDTARYPNAHLEKYGITREEAGFMKAVVKAMNGELDGYNLSESMTQIKELYDIDEDKLQEEGYVKRHSGVARRVYYSVTPEGQKACHRTKKHGFRVGDAGDDTPHRVGVELAQQYYEQLDDVRFVEISPRENGSKTDLVVVSTDFDRIATIEVEGGRVSADPGVPEDASSGINDYSSLRHDYRVLADSDGESVWVVRNHEVAGNVLRALTAGDGLPVTIDRETIRGIESGRVKIGEFNEELDLMGADGIDTILTFQMLRNRL
ncbi:MAG: hypothetical protein ABEI77_00795 [Halorientalis sp.]